MKWPFSSNDKDAIKKGAQGVEFVKSEKDYLEYIRNEYQEAKKLTEERAADWDDTKAAYDREEINYITGEEGDVSNKHVLCTGIVKEKTETKIALMLSNKPMPIPLPVIEKNYNGRLDGKDAANNQKQLTKIWNALFEDFRERRKLTALYSRLMQSDQLYGIGICKVYEEYDQSINDMDIMIDYCNPRGIHFICSNVDIRKSRAIFYEDWMYPYELKAEYPRKYKDIMGSINDDGVKRTYNEMYGSDKKHRGQVKVIYCYTKDLTHSIGFINLADGSEITEDEAIMLDQQAALEGTEAPQIEEKVIYKYPNGRMSVFLECGDDKSILLYDKENRFRGGPPYFGYIGNVNEDDHYGLPAAADLVSWQRYDDTLMQHAEVQIAAGAWFKILGEKGSGIEFDKVIPGIQKIPCNKTHSIQAFQPQGLINDIVGAHGVVLDMARQISGMEAAISGKSIPQARSGVAIRELKQSSGLKTQISYDMFLEFQAELFKCVADYMRANYKKGRKLRVSDMDGAPMELPEDLLTITGSIDIKIDTDSSLEMNDAAKASIGMQLATAFRDELNVPYIGLDTLSQWVKMPGMKDADADYMKRREMAIQQIQQSAAAKSGPGGEEMGNPSLGMGGNPEMGSPTGMPDGAGMSEEALMQMLSGQQ